MTEQHSEGRYNLRQQTQNPYAQGSSYRTEGPWQPVIQWATRRQRSARGETSTVTHDTDTSELVDTGNSSEPSTVIMALKDLDAFSQKFTGEPKSPVTLDNLRSTYAAWEATHKLQSGYERLTTTDKFHVIMSKTGGAAHDTCLSLLTEKEDQLAKHNESMQANYLREKSTAEQLIAAWDAQTPEQRGTINRPTLPPEPPLVSTFLGDPVAELWARLLQAYPKDSAAKIQAYGDFKVEDNESITTASQRMAKLALDLKQPQTQAAEKLLNALPWGIQAKVRTKLQFQYEDISTWTVELIRSEAEKLEKIINQEKLLNPKTTTPNHSNNNAPARSDSRNRNRRAYTIKCDKCGRLGHTSANCGRSRTNRSSAKAAQTTPASFEPGPCFVCHQPGHRAAQCPKRQETDGPRHVRIPGKPWCTHHNLNTHDSSQCMRLHPELANNVPKSRSRAAANAKRRVRQSSRDNNRTKELWKEYEQRHQPLQITACASRGSSPASSVEIASENPLPSHVKRERARGIQKQDKDEQFEFDINNTELKINKQTQAKAARRNRVRRNTPPPEPTTITRKRERKRVEKSYSRKRTETQFLRRNPDMPLSFRPAEEIEKFRSNARGGDANNNINYTEKSETFRSLEIAKMEAPRLPYYVPKEQLRTEAQRKQDDDEKHARGIQTTKNMEAERKLSPIITDPDHPNYENWKDPADPRWIGSPRTPPADPHPWSYKNPHPDFQEILKKDPRGYDFGFQSLTPEEQQVQMATLAARTPRPTGSESASHTSSTGNGPPSAEYSQKETSRETKEPDLVNTSPVPGRPESQNSLDIQCHSEKAARASFASSCTSCHQLASGDEATLDVDTVDVGRTNQTSGHIKSTAMANPCQQQDSPLTGQEKGILSCPLQAATANAVTSLLQLAGKGATSSSDHYVISPQRVRTMAQQPPPGPQGRGPEHDFLVGPPTTGVLPVPVQAQPNPGQPPSEIGTSEASESEEAGSEASGSEEPDPEAVQAMINDALADVARITKGDDEESEEESSGEETSSEASLVGSDRDFDIEEEEGAAVPSNLPPPLRTRAAALFPPPAITTSPPALALAGQDPAATTAAAASTTTPSGSGQSGGPPPGYQIIDPGQIFDQLKQQPEWDPANTSVLGTAGDPLSPWRDTHWIRDAKLYPAFYWQLPQTDRDLIGPVICIASRRAPKASDSNQAKVDKEFVALQRNFRKFTDANSAQALIKAIHHADSTEAAYAQRRAQSTPTSGKAQKGKGRAAAPALTLAPATPAGPQTLTLDTQAFQDMFQQTMTTMFRGWMMPTPGMAAAAGGPGALAPPLPSGPPPPGLAQYYAPMAGTAPPGYRGLVPQTYYGQPGDTTAAQGTAPFGPPPVPGPLPLQTGPPLLQTGPPSFQIGSPPASSAPPPVSAPSPADTQLPPPTPVPQGTAPVATLPVTTTPQPGTVPTTAPPLPSAPPAATSAPVTAQVSAPLPTAPPAVASAPPQAAPLLPTTAPAVAVIPATTAPPLPVGTVPAVTQPLPGAAPTTTAGIPVPGFRPAPPAGTQEQQEQQQKRKKKKKVKNGSSKKQKKQSPGPGPGPGTGGGGGGPVLGAQANPMDVRTSPRQKLARNVRTVATTRAKTSRECESVISDMTEPSPKTETGARRILSPAQIRAVGFILDLTSEMELEFHWTSAHSLPTETTDKLEKGLAMLVTTKWLFEPEPLVYHFVRPSIGAEVTPDFHDAWKTVALFMRLCLASQFLHATASGVYRHYTWCEVKKPDSIRHRIYAPPLALCGLPVHQANAARQSKLFQPFMQDAARLRLNKFSHSERVSGFHHAPRIDNSGPNPPFLINGVALEWLTVDTGCESVIISNWTAKKLGITAGMRQKKAISLITADAVTTAPVDRTWDTVEISINPHTSAATTVQVKLTIVPSQTKETLIGMSVIGRIGLTPDPYKQVMTYYTRWWEEESPTAELPSVFNVDLLNTCISAATSSRINQVTLAYAGRLVAHAAPRPPSQYERICTGPLLAPQATTDVRSVRLQLEFRDQLGMQSIIAHFQRTLRSLTDPPPPAILLAARYGSPLDQSLVDIHEQTAVNSEGIVIVELCSGLCATTEALVRNGVKVRRVYACEIDPLCRMVAQQRLTTLVQLYPHLIATEAMNMP